MRNIICTSSNVNTKAEFSSETSRVYPAFTLTYLLHGAESFLRS